MARPFKHTDNAIDSLCRSLARTGCYKDSSLKTARYTCRVVCKHIQELDSELTPMTMTSDDVISFHQLLIDKGLEINTQRLYMWHLKLLCEFLHNDCFKDVRLVYGQDTRPNVHWLTPEDAETVLRSAMSPIEDICIWLALCHGLRRVEITRLQIGDIDIERGTIKVIGKGRGQGKIRYVHCHPNFSWVYHRWMVERKEQTNRSQETSTALLTYERSGIQSGFQVDAISKIINRVSVRTGIHFSPHTLRRTFGRELWRSGVRITTIANILGHESIEITILYLGINLDDQAEAMQRLSLGNW